MINNSCTKLTLLLFLCISSLKTNAQLSNSFYDDNSVWQVSAIYAKAENTWSDKTYDRYVAMYSADLSFYKSNFKAGGFQRSYRTKLSDFVPQLISPLFKESRDQLFNKSGLPVLTSLMGWYNFGWAVVSKDHVQFSVGGHLGGYTHGIELESQDENNIGDSYPFLSGGPAVFLDINLLFGLELHYEGAYAFSYMLDPDKTVPDGETPTFLNQNLQLRKNRWFLSFELVNGLVEIGNSIQRSQIGIGVGF
ncbi:hypothetical protein FHR24_000615 [Wenyingzhuangia heitensis]|uniref:Outer membrane protein beta-barrel domain-containing protein n=1 Tax=Wenyingzhuangia heitensis TaxID=1487859 RepID=A0ABX0UAJ7_9FLAO|nr:hypothetical protein [Wenyingzhuangia heitensis]NIJ44176.1 hypothetical protein [Wenyingzhuangia heitensis]